MVPKYKTFQADIVRRFLSDKNYETFVEDYMASRKHGRRSGRDITPFDRKVFKDYKDGGLMFGELMRKYKKSRNVIMYSVAIAAKE